MIGLIFVPGTPPLALMSKWAGVDILVVSGSAQDKLDPIKEDSDDSEMAEQKENQILVNQASNVDYNEGFIQCRKE
ncbi:hypothetical protein UPYG_G00245220 [Umbra pygmaea]|uniref:Uncharacterized protein n=1 Tax=Umbra pygmaea TaxID=75934 RepID=A0ABD0WKZ5_UMBPY